jgi:nicotinamide mononucleotide transporter
MTVPEYYTKVIRREKLIGHLVEAFALASLFTSGSYAIALWAGWLPDGINPLEAFAVYTSYACTWLCVRQRRINYPIGAVSTAAYAVLFWQSDLAASAILNAYLCPYLVYGWFRWRSDDQARPVSRLKLRWLPMYIILTALTYWGAVEIVEGLGGRFAPADALILIGTVLAQMLLDNKKLETWAVWAVVNVAAIYTYFSSGLPLAGFQYVLFLVNTVVGFWMWNRSREWKAVGVREATPDEIAATQAARGDF